VKELDVSILTTNWNKPRLGNSEEAPSKYHMMKETNNERRYRDCHCYWKWTSRLSGQEAAWRGLDLQEVIKH